MLYHDKGGVKIRWLRPGLPGCPGLSFLVVVVSSSSGGDIILTENPARARRSKPGRGFYQTVAPGINSFGSGGHNPENSKKISALQLGGPAGLFGGKFGAVRPASGRPGAAGLRPS